MKIFIDTAKLSEIREAISWGIVHGVTTNPSLIKQAMSEIGGNIKMEDYIREILKVAGKDRDVSLEVIATTEGEMYEQAKKLHKKFSGLFDNVAIKIPVNPTTEPGKIPSLDFDGLKVTKRLSGEGIKVNLTLIMTPEQAMLGAIAGARYVSPFAGRIDDDLRKKAGAEFKKDEYYEAAGREGFDDNGIVSGVDLVEKTIQIFKKYNFKTEIIAASLRNARQVREIALAGAHISTIPFEVLKKMVSHRKTLEGMQKFIDDIVPEYKNLFD